MLFRDSSYCVNCFVIVRVLGPAMRLSSFTDNLFCVQATETHTHTNMQRAQKNLERDKKYSYTRKDNARGFYWPDDFFFFFNCSRLENALGVI